MTTRLALPCFGDHLAPRFCFADEVLVVDVDGGEVLQRSRLSWGGVPWPARLEQLADRGVVWLLCAGIHRAYLPRAEALGLRVVWGLGGSLEQVVGAFADGELERLRLRPWAEPGGRRGGGGPPRGLGRGGPHRRGRGAGRCRREENR